MHETIISRNQLGIDVQIPAVLNENIPLNEFIQQHTNDNHRMRSRVLPQPTGPIDQGLRRVIGSIYSNYVSIKGFGLLER